MQNMFKMVILDADKYVEKYVSPYITEGYKLLRHL